VTNEKSRVSASLRKTVRTIDINDFVFKNTLFYKCGFYGCKNAPTLEGDCKVIDADISEDFDGSKIISSDTLFQNWKIERQAVST
jgi:hypothetical protein